MATSGEIQWPPMGSFPWPPSVHDPGWLRAGDMMVMGCGSRWGSAVRPLGLCGPSTRAWRQQSVGSWPRCIG